MRLSALRRRGSGNAGCAKTSWLWQGCEHGRTGRIFTGIKLVCRRGFWQGLELALGGRQLTPNWVPDAQVIRAATSASRPFSVS
jgi:hypothetical protein